MKKLFILMILLSSTQSFAFTLNPDTGRGFDSNDIPIHVANSTCSGTGFSTSELASMVKDAVDDYWNQVPTSALVLKSKGINSSIDIDGDDFSAALNKVPNNSIVAGCNDDVASFSNPAILGATVMDCNGDTCKAVLILNANNSSLNDMDRSERVAVIAHELGHAFGLGHSEYTHNLMYYATGGKTQKWLGQDDVDGISYLYPHDPELAGLLGSCGTIDTNTDRQEGFWMSLLLGFFFVSFILRYRHFLHKFSKYPRTKAS